MIFVNTSQTIHQRGIQTFLKIRHYFWRLLHQILRLPSTHWLTAYDIWCNFCFYLLCIMNHTPLLLSVNSGISWKQLWKQNANFIRHSQNLAINAEWQQQRYYIQAHLWQTTLRTSLPGIFHILGAVHKRRRNFFGRFWYSPPPCWNFDPDLPKESTQVVLLRVRLNRFQWTTWIYPTSTF